MKVSTLVGLLGLICVSAVAEEDTGYYFYGLGLSSVDNMASPKDTKFRSEFTPEVFVGAGHQYRFNADWVLDSELRLNYAETNIRSVEQIPDQFDKLSNLGIWATTKLKREFLFPNVSPYIELGVGAVNVDYDYANQATNSWTTGVRALAGLEFKISEDVSFALAVGKSDYAGNFD